jgi:hypothetical protein
MILLTNAGPTMALTNTASVSIVTLTNTQLGPTMTLTDKPLKS